MLEPWAQRVILAWRTNLGYYENRLEALRGFENEGLLWQTRITEDRVSARLGDPNHLLAFGPDRLEVSLLQPTGDTGLLEAAIRRVWEACAPTRIARPRMDFQWLVPLDRSYEEARATVIKTLYGGPYDIGINDWSTVLTGESDKPKSVFGCEFGIVEASEAPRRLGRQTGYFKGNGYETPLTVWATETLPPVAFFLDYSVVREGAVENSPEGVIRLWTETRAEVSAVVSELMNRVLGGKYE